MLAGRNIRLPEYVSRVSDNALPGLALHEPRSATWMMAERLVSHSLFRTRTVKIPAPRSRSSCLGSQPADEIGTGHRAGAAKPPPTIYGHDTHRTTVPLRTQPFPSATIANPTRQRAITHARSRSRSHARPPSSADPLTVSMMTISSWSSMPSRYCSTRAWTLSHKWKLARRHRITNYQGSDARTCTRLHADDGTFHAAINQAIRQAHLHPYLWVA
jgi:hypothetical protein